MLSCSHVQAHCSPWSWHILGTWKGGLPTLLLLGVGDAGTPSPPGALTHPVLDLCRQAVGRSFVELRGAHGRGDGPGREGQTDIRWPGRAGGGDQAVPAPCADWAPVHVLIRPGLADSSSRRLPEPRGPGWGGRRGTQPHPSGWEGPRGNRGRACWAVCTPGAPQPTPSSCSAWLTLWEAGERGVLGRVSWHFPNTPRGKNERLALPSSDTRKVLD